MLPIFYSPNYALRVYKQFHLAFERFSCSFMYTRLIPFFFETQTLSPAFIYLHLRFLRLLYVSVDSRMQFPSNTCCIYIYTHVKYTYAGSFDVPKCRNCLKASDRACIRLVVYSESVKEGKKRKKRNKRKEKEKNVVGRRS